MNSSLHKSITYLCFFDLLSQPSCQIFIFFDLLCERNLDTALTLFQFFYFGEGGSETHVALGGVCLGGGLDDSERKMRLTIKLTGTQRGHRWLQMRLGSSRETVMLVLTTLE